jgi:hypothetical protein
MTVSWRERFLAETVVPAPSGHHAEAVAGTLLQATGLFPMLAPSLIP